jgi:hypothetical protein
LLPKTFVRSKGEELLVLVLWREGTKAWIKQQKHEHWSKLEVELHELEIDWLDV